MPERLKIAGIVLAAGKGERFGMLKQFEMVGGRRLVDRAISLLKKKCSSVVLVLPKGVDWSGAEVNAHVKGGSSRVDSLAKGLAALPENADIVVVHDCARPLADVLLIESLLQAVQSGADAAVPGWVSPDVIKRVKPDGSLEHVGREEFVIVQGPIACRLSTLRLALKTVTENLVEETEAIERIGGRVVAVQGNSWSHHVVDAKDLEYIARIMPSDSNTK